MKFNFNFEFTVSGQSEINIESDSLENAIIDMLKRYNSIFDIQIINNEVDIKFKEPLTSIEPEFVNLLNPEFATLEFSNLVIEE